MSHIGVDLVNISRIREIVERHGERFLSRYFSKSEIEYSMGRGNPYPHLAARFAAKEAVFKAFASIGLNSMPLSSFEVAISPSGVPELRVSVSDSAYSRCSVAISLSHEREYAVAVAIIEDDFQ
ncbi:MAG: holo-ACP synthase [Candidatus Coatesbacteria bacterium]|nr:holo-ACP synthase [Candidatus Coatesbacteria bacterium]